MRHLQHVLAVLILTLLVNMGCGSRTVPTPNSGSGEPNGTVEVIETSESGSRVSYSQGKVAQPQGLGIAAGEPERWLDLGVIAPQPLAVQSQGRRAVVTVGTYLSVLYDLDSHEELRTWDHELSSAAFSSDGRRLVTVHTDVAVWDAERGAEICRIEGCTPLKESSSFYPWEKRVVLSEDGSLVAISNAGGSFDQRLADGVLVFEVESGRLHKALATGYSSAIGPLGFAQNGTRLVTSSLHQRPAEPGDSAPSHVWRTTLWDMGSGELLCEFPDEVHALVSPDGRWIATGCVIRDWSRFRAGRIDTRSLTVWDARTGEPVQTLNHEHLLHDFAFSPESKKILVGLAVRKGQDILPSYGGRIVEWDWPSARELFAEDSEKRFARVMYSPDGRRRFTLTEEVNVLDATDYHLRGWEVKTGAALPISDDWWVSTNLVPELFFFPEADRFVKLWWGDFAEIDVLTGKTLRQLPPRRVGARSPSFAPDGQRVLVHSRGGHLLDLSTGEQRRWGTEVNWTTARFVGDGRLALAHSSRHLSLIDPMSDAIIWQFPLEIPVVGLAISPDARRIAVASGVARYRRFTPHVVLIDTLTPHGLRFIERSAMALSYHHDGRRFVEASSEHVYECDSESGERMRSLFSVPGRTLDICCSPDGTRILACGVVGYTDPLDSFDSQDEGWVMLWDEATGNTIRLEGHTAPVVSAAFGPDGLRCATGSLDRTIRLWDTSSGELLHTFRGHLGEIHGIAYSSKGDRIVSTAQDGAAIWNVARYAAVPVKPRPLAPKLTMSRKSESMDYSPGLVWEREYPGKRSVTEYLPTPAGDQYRDEWTAILYGHGTFRDLPRSMGRVLGRPARTVHSKGPSPPPRTLAFGRGYNLMGTAKDGSRRLYVSGPERSILLADATDEILRKWDAPKPATRLLALSPSGDEVVIAQKVASESETYRLTFEDALTGALLREFVYEDGRRIGRIDVGPLGETILLRVSDSDIVLLDYHTCETLGEISRPRGPIPDAQYSPDGRYIAVKAGREITLHDRVTLAQCKQLVHPLFVRWYRFSPDGKRPVTGQVNEILTMWDVDAAQPLWMRQGYTGEDTVFSRDGTRFVSQVRFDLSFLWDAIDGQLIAVVIGAGFPTLSPDGRSLHLGGPEGPTIWSDR